MPRKDLSASVLLVLVVTGGFFASRALAAFWDM